MVVGNRSRAIMEAAPARSSNMEAPIMLLRYLPIYNPPVEYEDCSVYELGVFRQLSCS